jgi:hypothetical protein
MTHTQNIKEQREDILIEEQIWDVLKKISKNYRPQGNLYPS